MFMETNMLYILHLQIIKRTKICKVFSWQHKVCYVAGRNDRLHKIGNTECLFYFYQKYQGIN